MFTLSIVGWKSPFWEKIFAVFLSTIERAHLGDTVITPTNTHPWFETHVSSAGSFFVKFFFWERLCSWIVCFQDELMRSHPMPDLLPCVDVLKLSSVQYSPKDFFVPSVEWWRIHFFFGGGFQFYSQFIGFQANQSESLQHSCIP